MYRLIDEQLRSRLSGRMNADAGVDVAGALNVAVGLSDAGCRPGDGRTHEYLRTLSTLGLLDASLARVVEPHLDAHAILRQSGRGAVLPEIAADPTSTWGVYAAHGPDHTLEAQHGAGGWTLSGTKPWCSLSDRLTHAVITAAVPGEGQRAFAVRLDPRYMRTVPTPWVSRGLTAIASGPIELAASPAVALGGPDWYLQRPGFAWGGVGVAAVWFGVALAFRDRLLDRLADRPRDPLGLAQLGSVDERLFAAQSCLEYAAAAIDAGADDQLLLGQRVRAVVARSAENAMCTAGHVLGPGPLVADEEYARRVADLSVYLRQHHGQRDLAYLGELAATEREAAHV